MLKQQIASVQNLNSPIHTESVELIGLNMASLQVGSSATFTASCLPLFIFSYVHPLLVSLSQTAPFWICFFLALHSSITQSAGLACRIAAQGVVKYLVSFQSLHSSLVVVVVGGGVVPPHLYCSLLSAPQLTLSWLSLRYNPPSLCPLGNQTSQQPPSFCSGCSLYTEF